MTFIKQYLNRQMLFEFAPGLVFLITNFGWGIMWATVAVIVAAVIFTLLGALLARRVPVFPVISVVLVLILGGATLLFQDETFIKIKTTVSISLFACALLLGLLLRPTLLARALDSQISLSESGWRVLTLRWVIFAVAMAGLNELVWRTQSTDFWVVFSSVLTPASIVGYIVITRFTAPAYWVDTVDDG